MPQHQDRVAFSPRIGPIPTDSSARTDPTRSVKTADTPVTTNLHSSSIETGNSSCQFRSPYHARHKLFKSKICLYDQSGFCRKGNRCNFAHISDLDATGITLLDTPATTYAPEASPLLAPRVQCSPSNGFSSPLWSNYSHMSPIYADNERDSSRLPDLSMLTANSADVHSELHTLFSLPPSSYWPDSNCHGSPMGNPCASIGESGAAMIPGNAISPNNSNNDSIRGLDSPLLATMRGDWYMLSLTPLGCDPQNY